MPSWTRFSGVGFLADPQPAKRRPNDLAIHNPKANSACSRFFALKLSAANVLRAVFFFGVGDADADSPFHPSVDRAGTAKSLKNVRVVHFRDVMDQGARALQFGLDPADFCQHLRNFSVVVFFAIMDRPKHIEHNQLRAETTELLDKRVHVIVARNFEISLVMASVDQHPVFEPRIFWPAADELLDASAGQAWLHLRG